ncbi:MAG: amino acid ABC transporter permease [Proteobacteria bacterium]|nr:amino acid ABC transporter permease [Pseudomonadota bacterium]
MAAVVQLEKTAARSAPLSETTVLGWLRKNLFSSWTNTALTIISIYIIYAAVKGFYVWGVADAVWVAKDRRECFDISIDGACWAGVIQWMNNFIYGRYPRGELWRVNLGGLMLVLWMAPLWVPRVKDKILIGMSTVFLYPFLAGYFFAGGEKGIFMQVMVTLGIVCLIGNTLNMIIGVSSGRGLREVMIQKLGKQDASDESQRNTILAIFVGALVVVFVLQMWWTFEAVSWTKWGGMFLTLVISGIGIAAALPLGIFLALGRRSKLPVIRVLCTAFIEIFRSVPLITVLFMATTMFPLFMPEGVPLNKLTQVIIAVCLFSGCYMAETVRAGLQAIPNGQYEAAHTIGLGYWGTMGLIVMPQALKHMIPNIVGSFIGLLKDTTLVSIIGLFDVLGMLRSVSQDIPWRGLHKEPLLFGAMLFFIVCFAMSKYSRHLEVKLSAGDNR